MALGSALCLIGDLAWAYRPGENLAQELPAGYKVDLRAKKWNMLTAKMVPEGESTRNWSEMLTTQVFLGAKTASPRQFREFIDKQWLTGCKGGSSASIAEGEDNGYPFAIWKLSCPGERNAGKPALASLKAIKGRDHFYVVQKTFRYAPSIEQIEQSIDYLKAIQLCDTRQPAPPCSPGVMAEE